MTQPAATIIAALLSALIGGVAAAIVSYFLNRTRAAAETEKIRVETEKLRLEIKQLAETVNYALPQAKELVIFDGRAGIDGFDVKGEPGRFWQGEGKDAKPVSAKGEGSLQIEEGRVLNIQRTNTEGRYEVFIRKYDYGGKTHDFLPKNESIGGKRKLRISCEAKTIDSDHSLRFVVRHPQSGRRFAEETKCIVSQLR